MKKVFLFIVLLSFITGITAIDLNLEEIKSLALENNPDLLSEHHNWKSAEMDKWNAASGLIPSGSLDGSITKYEPDFAMAEELRSYGFSISQPIFNGGKIWLNYRIKNDVAKRAKTIYEDKVFEVLSQVENYYFQVLEAEDLVEIAQKDLQSSNNTVTIAEANFDSGIISKGEYYQIQSENSSKEVSLIQTQNLLSTARLQLANYLQISMDYNLSRINLTDIVTEISAINKIDFNLLDQISQRFSQRLQDVNSSLKIADLNRKISRKSLWIAAGNFLPSLNLSFSKSWDKYDYQDEYDDSQRLMLIASVPIFPLTDNVTNYIKTRHQYKSTHYTSKILEDNVNLSLSNTITTLVSSAKSVKSAQLAKDYAQETYNQAQERFRNNLISSSDMIAIDAMLLSAKRNYVSSIYNYLISKSQLMRITQIKDKLEFIQYFEIQ